MDSRFRPIRRHKQALSAEKIQEILERGTHGVLALSGDDGYPYAVPLNYVYENGVFYFHCAKSGHKLDALKRDQKCSFCVIDAHEVVGEELTTYYRSVIAFGKIRILNEQKDLLKIADRFAKRFDPSIGASKKEEYFQKELPLLTVLELCVEHMTGKEAIELKKGRT